MAHSAADQAYLDILQTLVTAPERKDRTGVGTRGLFGAVMRHQLGDGHTFPILSTKSVHFKSVVVELLWFLRGDTNVAWLHEHGVTIWDEWADEDGELGPVYGKQWRSWLVRENEVGDDVVVDQIANLIAGLRNDPYGRRHIVSAWNPAEISNMALPPCHTLFQFYVHDGKLSCHLYQRSADWFLGVPFNMAQYALLTHLIARECDLGVGEFIHSFGDYHLYSNHIDAAQEQLARLSPLDSKPRLVIAAPYGTSIFDLEPHHIWLENYRPLARIAAPVAV